MRTHLSAHLFTRSRSALLAVLLCLGLLLSACGGTPVVTPPTDTPATSEPAPATSEPQVPTDEPVATEATDEQAEGQAISSREDMQQAVIQIVARGTFIDPKEGELRSVAGSGSGFIISPDGIAVTNNHVVTGAGTIDVYIGGETKPRHAKVLGVSECADLAVIDIDGDGFSYLRWYDGKIKVGMDVYAAGFPLGDPEFTMTRGVVAKAKADGDTDWASVETVIEHDAVIRPGNSGGPLITADAEVLAINYAGNRSGQYYAIGRDAATEVIDQLREGSDVHAIGLNGVALKGKNVSGIWVSSVKSGSPADKARIEPGDFITAMEGVDLASDGTMRDYCSILRSRNASDVLSVDVYRSNGKTFEHFKGQINGRELERAGGPTGQAQPTQGSQAQAQPTAPAASTSLIDSRPWADADVAKAREMYSQLFNQFKQRVKESFDRGNTTRRSWRELDNTTQTTRLRNNAYLLTLKQPSRLVREFYRENGKDVAFGSRTIVEAEVAFASEGAQSSVGLVFDGQANGDGVAFLMRNDGTWQVFTRANGKGVAEYSTGAVKTSAIINGRNQLRVTRLDDTIIFWINHTPVGVMKGSPFNGGMAGVAILSGANLPTNITVEADNFFVWQ